MDTRKIAAIGAALEADFPDCTVEDMDDFDRDGRRFNLIRHTHIVHRVTFVSEFIDDWTTEQILAKLNALPCELPNGLHVGELRLADALRMAGTELLTVHNPGRLGPSFTSSPTTRERL